LLNKVIKSPYFVVISVTIVIVFSLAAGMQNYGSSFIQDFISNWLATLLGAMIGVPLALWVSGIQERKIESGKKNKNSQPT
jgi:glycopeptide antibiotics resistance protein